MDEGERVAETVGERYHTACIFVLVFVLEYGTTVPGMFFSLGCVFNVKGSVEICLPTV